MTVGRDLFIRAAAFGDVLLTQPFLAAVREADPGVAVDLYTLHTDLHWPGGGQVLSMKTESLASVMGLGYRRIHWFSYEHVLDLHILDGYHVSTGLPILERVPTWVVSPSERAFRDRILDGLPRPIVGFHPASHAPERSLPSATAQETIRALRKAFGGTVVVTGERRLGLEDCLDLSGRTRSLRELAALVEGMDALLTVDTGPFHLAQAFGLPMVGVFGCTLPELRATRTEGLQTVLLQDLDCLGCHHRAPAGAETLSGCGRGDLACMVRIEPAALVAALRRARDGAVDAVLRARIQAYEERRPALLADLAGRGEAIRKAYRERIQDLDRKLGGFKRFRRRVRALFP